MMEETERMIAQRLGTLAGGHPAIQKQSKQAEKEAKNLFFKTNQKTFVFKAISVIEQQDIKVKKLN